jgi:hypothetical protein
MSQQFGWLPLQAEAADDDLRRGLSRPAPLTGSFPGFNDDRLQSTMQKNQ